MKLIEKDMKNVAERVIISLMDQGKLADVSDVVRVDWDELVGIVVLELLQDYSGKKLDTECNHVLARLTSEFPRMQVVEAGCCDPVGTMVVDLWDRYDDGYLNDYPHQEDCDKARNDVREHIEACESVVAVLAPRIAKLKELLARNEK